MVATGQLPIPQITARRFGARCLPALTDDALYERTGVRVAFTGRAGGVSEGPYSSLNLGNHVGDGPASVERNRALVLEALDAADVPLVVPSQVHGEVVVELDDASPEALDAAREAADIVLMNDKPSDISYAVRISRKTMSIVRENIVFALAVKAIILILSALGISGMWAAVFADVGVMVLAVLNAVRMLRFR